MTGQASGLSSPPAHDCPPDVVAAMVSCCQGARHCEMHFCALHRDQLQDLSDVLASTDAMLMQRLNQLDSAECYFAYRMLLVMLRRELSLPQVGPWGYCSMPPP